jgi:hypothetical protein
VYIVVVVVTYGWSNPCGEWRVSLGILASEYAARPVASGGIIVAIRGSPPEDGAECVR